MAGQNNTASKVKAALEPVINELGYRVWDVEYVKEASEWYLRITIDNDEGIDINDCEKVHRTIDPILDDLDPIEDSYHLEVSSPGIERDLRTKEHFECCIGENVEVRLFAPINGQKVYSGTLSAYHDDIIELDTGNATVEIPRDKASKVKTIFEF